MFGWDRAEVKAWAKSRLPFFWKKRFSIALVIASAAVLFLFRNFIEMLAVMALFIAFGIASMMYNRWVKISLGIEFILLGTVITGLVYGKFPALIVGMVSLFFAEVITDRFTYSTFVSFAGIFAVSMVAPMLDGISVTWAGIWMTVLYDAIIGPGYIIMGSSLWRTLLFVVTHILFNIWAFVFIAPLVLRLAGG